MRLSLRARISESKRCMNDVKEKTVCFTGHRRVIHKHLEEQLDEIVTSLAEAGYLYFGIGGAKGFDYLAAKSVLRVQERFPAIKLIIVIPCSDYYDRWMNDDKSLYFDILKKADKVRVMSDHYYRGCMQVRNKYLADNSSVCVNYLYKNEGGTAFTVEYARKKGLTLVSVI